MNDDGLGHSVTMWLQWWHDEGWGWPMRIKRKLMSWILLHSSVVLLQYDYNYNVLDNVKEKEKEMLSDEHISNQYADNVRIKKKIITFSKLWQF